MAGLVHERTFILLLEYMRAKKFSLNASLVGGEDSKSGGADVFFFPIFLDQVSTRISGMSFVFCCSELCRSCS